MSRHPPQEAGKQGLGFISQRNLPYSWGETCFDMKLNQRYIEIMMTEKELNRAKICLFILEWNRMLFTSRAVEKPCWLQ